MNKNTLILNKILLLTNNNKLNWNIILINNNLSIFECNYFITKRKFVQIILNYDKRKILSSLIFNYINDDKHIKTEILEIYPNSYLNIIKQQIELRKIKKIYKSVK